MNKTERSSSESNEDPVYRSSVREASVALVAWLVLGIFSISYCMATGYGRPPEEIETTWGIPHWVLFGVFAPWMAANVFTWWFAFRLVEDSDLGDDGSEAENVDA